MTLWIILALAAVWAVSAYLIYRLMKWDIYRVHIRWFPDETDYEPELDAGDIGVLVYMAALGPFGLMTAYAASVVWFWGEGQPKQRDVSRTDDSPRSTQEPICYDPSKWTGIEK